MIETTKDLYFLAFAETLDEAIKIAAADTTEFLQKKLDLDFPDAYRLLRVLSGGRAIFTEVGVGYRIAEGE